MIGCTFAFFVIILLLCRKIRLLKRGMKEIAEELETISREDTNRLLTVSCRDKALLRLADRLNTQLRLLAQARCKYQQGDLKLKDAVTNISHDLRTPLTAVSGYLELLESEPHSPKTLRYLEIINTRVADMKALTEELFRYSVSLSVQEPENRPISLNRQLEESLLGLYGAMKQEGITPAVSIPSTPVMRMLNEASLSRIFNNIINNAIKYSDGDFSAILREDGTITFSNTASALDPVMTAKLFDRFYTVETARDSTGLGLSIAKLLTERLGGSITAEYREGKLWITLRFPELLNSETARVIPQQHLF